MQCLRCGATKADDEFVKDGRRINGRNAVCKLCRWKAVKARRENDREAYLKKKQMQSWRRYARKEGITVEEYIARLTAKKERLAKPNLRACNNI